MKRNNLPWTDGKEIHHPTDEPNPAHVGSSDRGKVRLNVFNLAGVVSPTLNVNPTLFVIPSNFFGDYRITVLQLLSLTKQFVHPKLNHPCQYCITSC